MALFYICYIDYVRSKAKNDFVEWDVKTITAGDYTVEVDIPKSMFEKYVSDIYDPDYGMSKATCFRNYMKKELQKRIQEFPNLGYEDEGAEMKIAQVTFCFSRAPLINMLRKRGLFIKTQKFDKMRDMDKKIDAYLDSHLEEM